MSASVVEPTVRDRLLKVLRLAREGVGGERDNAEAALEKLLRHHRLTLEQLERSERSGERAIWWFLYTDVSELTILAGIIDRVIGEAREIFQTTEGPTRLGAELSAGERAEILVSWEVYAPAWRAAARELTLAFCGRHALYDQARRRERDRGEHIERPDIEELRRVRTLMDGLAHVETPRQRLAAGGTR